MKLNKVLEGIYIVVGYLYAIVGYTAKKLNLQKLRWHCAKQMRKIMDKLNM